MMRYYYASSVKEFMLANDILQTLTINSEHAPCTNSKSSMDRRNPVYEEYS